MEKQKITSKTLYIDIIDVLPCSLFLTFTFFVFGPLQMYLTNKNEFWFKLTHILPTIILSFIMIFTILNLFAIIIPKKLKKYYAAFIFGLGFALYIQGNFINLNYGVLDGSEIDWNSYGYLGTINTIAWLMCLLLPVILTKIWPIQVEKVIKIGSCFIVAVQALTLGALLISTDFSSQKKISVTGNDMFSLSPEKNEIVFILDTFDASYMNKVLEEYPEYKEQFSDFTYYENTLGMYPTTKGALPHILTGEKYINNIPYNEYIEDAFNKTILYDTLISSGYDIGIYTTKTFLPSNSSGVFVNIIDKYEKPSSYMDLGLMMYKSTAFSYFPHIVKKKFWFSSSDFNKYIAISDQNKHSPDNIDFYNRLLSDNLSINNDAYAFRLYHLDGVHPPYKTTSQLTYDDNGTSLMEVSLGSLNVILEYINQLKKSGLYDKTAIIVMADHGNTGLKQNPLLMIKPMNTRSEFKISSAPVSYDDLLNTMLFLATGDSKYNPNVFSWSENDVRNRMYLYYNWDDSWNKDYLPDIYEYSLYSSIMNIEQMKKTGTVYTSSGIIRNYSVKVSLGENLQFPNNGKIQGAFEYGFSGDEGSHIWSLGKKAKLLIVIDNSKLSEDMQLALALKFKYFYGYSQRINLYLNGTFISEKTITSVSKPTIFEFPAELIMGSDVLEIEFEFPDAFQKPESRESRVLALAFENMIIDYAQNLFNYVKVGEENIKVDFSESGTSDTIINEGWYGQEPSHRWTSEKADICFVADEVQDYLLTVEYSTYHNSGDTHVLYNGEEIALWNRNAGNHTESIILPAELFNKGGKQTVTFVTDNAKSPLESGESNDSRVLGISVKTMTLEVKK